MSAVERERVKHITALLPLTQVNLVALCTYLSQAGWSHVGQWAYRKDIDGTDPVDVYVPSSPTTPALIEAAEAFADIILLLSIDENVSLDDVIASVLATAESNEERGVFQTIDHRCILSPEAVTLAQAVEDDELGFPLDVENYQHVILQPGEAIAHAEYILAHRDVLEQRQRDLDALWLNVAEDVMAFLEERRSGAFLEATGQQIQAACEELARLSLSEGHTGSKAGQWYRSLWDGLQSTGFVEVWRPFLRVCARLQHEGRQAQREDE